ncbi:hypothetical protein MTN95_05980 [Bacillus sp. 2CMS4F]|uniref:hypothetical protein n=1 Tax=Bacillus sp. 2CMS4F TaxID=2929170 RepID=UPI0020BFFE6F|nr:hypothetical protein [Bacillus sp. 2CMS4F]MCK8098936.1 hypothetical protein [Bacillus sp. 2CMS4F]
MFNDIIQYVQFSELDVYDPFFSSLIEDYVGFEKWFQKKAMQGEKAYILKEDRLLGFLYLKEEFESDETINPIFEKKRRLKIGTFKIEAHGTVLGHRFIGIILKKMIDEHYSECYVTVFEKQKPLIKLFEKFGFTLWGRKNNGELIYIKTLEKTNDIFMDFPRIDTQNKNKYILSIYPIWHTKLFPDSKLNTERNHKIEDLSFTNTIEKVYLSGMKGLDELTRGDLIVIYRTAESGKRAEFSAVATSICTVIENRNIHEFNTMEEFISYCGKGTIFSKEDLEKFWYTKKYPYIIKMLYNISLPKRIIRHHLITNGIIERNAYAGFIKLTDQAFEKILKLGEINESFIIN